MPVNQRDCPRLEAPPLSFMPLSSACTPPSSLCPAPRPLKSKAHPFEIVCKGVRVPVQDLRAKGHVLECHVCHPGGSSPAEHGRCTHGQRTPNPESGGVFLAFQLPGTFWKSLVGADVLSVVPDPRKQQLPLRTNMVSSKRLSKFPLPLPLLGSK